MTDNTYTDHPELQHWRKNVGDDVALDLAPPLSEPPARLHVLCWNLAIGSADLAAALVHVRANGAAEGPIVILAQEAFRSDSTVPELPLTHHHGGKSGLATRNDIVRFARSNGLSLRYAPSMRNGASRSDRGNAILSTVALAESNSYQLPHVRQRRVAVAATVRGVSDLLLVSAHLDTRGQSYGRRLPGRFGAGRVVQAAGLAQRLMAAHDRRTLLIGADLNTFLGRRDPAFEALRMAGFEPVETAREYSYTFRPFRLMLDHVLLRPGSLAVRSARVHRIDASIAGRRVLGSDHHPLLTTIEFSS